MSHDIFVSYSSKDKAVADAIVSALENSGLRCWVAPRDVKPGADWGDSITEAISGCKTVILIFSGNSNQSKHVKDELYYAIAEEKIILPFRIENLDPTGAMRLHLASRHWLDAFQPSWKAHINRLIESVADSIGRTPLPPARLDETYRVERRHGATDRRRTPLPPARLDETPNPDMGTPKKKGGKKAPWLWVGLVVFATTILSVGVFLWFGNRNADEDAQPTTLSALITKNTATSTARALPTRTSTPQLKTHIVTSPGEYGAGTLAEALWDARAGDSIKFDPEIFPPDSPTTIFITTELPRISQGSVNLDASDAGVILDGSKLQGGFGLIINSDHNYIRGLQMVNFPGIAVYIEGGSFNTLGGDRNIGTGPVGQGNLISNSFIGINILSQSGGNVITGNLIGTDLSGIEPNGNWKAGIWLENNQVYQPIRNTIGPGNVIAFNGEASIAEGDSTTGGIELDTDLPATTITANAIHDNVGPGIFYNITDPAPDAYPEPPAILFFDLDAGTVSGQSCKDCVVEIFSTETQDGKIYEGTVTADQYGNFIFHKGQALSGPYLTATARSTGHNTSEFSLASPARSDIQIALETIQKTAPVYQSSFDTWNLINDPMEKASIEDGKLIITSKNENVGAAIHNYPSDRFAVEFEFRILESGADDRCYFGVENDHDNEGSKRSLGAGFGSNGQVILEHYIYPESYPLMAESRYENLNPNTATFIYLAGKIAAFVNGQLVYTTLDPDGSAVYTHHTFSAEKTIVCEFDNYKLWDLSRVDFNP